MDPFTLGQILRVFFTAVLASSGVRGAAALIILGMVFWMIYRAAKFVIGTIEALFASRDQERLAFLQQMNTLTNTTMNRVAQQDAARSASDAAMARTLENIAIHQGLQLEALKTIKADQEKNVKWLELEINTIKERVAK